TTADRQTRPNMPYCQNGMLVLAPGLAGAPKDSLNGSTASVAISGAMPIAASNRIAVLQENHESSVKPSFFASERHSRRNDLHHMGPSPAYALAIVSSGISRPTGTTSRSRANIRASYGR